MNYAVNRALPKRHTTKKPSPDPDISTTLNQNSPELSSPTETSTTISTLTNPTSLIKVNLEKNSTTSEESSTLQNNLTKVTWTPQDLNSNPTEDVSFDDVSTPLPSVQPPVLLENPLEGKFKSEKRWGFRSGNFGPPPILPPPPAQLPPRHFENRPPPRPYETFPESNPPWALPPWIHPFQSPFPFWPDLDYFDQGPFGPIPPYDDKFPPPFPLFVRGEVESNYERIPPRERFIFKK